MEFQDAFHKKRFEDLIKRDRTQDKDVERQTLFFILASEQLYGKVEQFYDFEEHFIKPEGLEDVFLSSAQKAIVALAFNLYGNVGDYTVFDTFKSLDRKNFDLAIQAIRVRFPKS